MRQSAVQRVGRPLGRLMRLSGRWLPAVIAFCTVFAAAASSLTAAAAGVAVAATSSSAATALYAWGDNTIGEFGQGLTSDGSTFPVQTALPDGTTLTAVASGATSLAVDSDGDVYEWGSNPAGAGTIGLTQVPLPAGVTATAVAEGLGTNLVLGSDGNVYAWGADNEGQVGNGTLTSFTSVAAPVQVSLPGGVTATAIAEGDATTLAVGSDGNVYAWGNDNDGQLGNGIWGDNQYSLTPVQVSLPGGVAATAVSEGFGFSLALGANGDVYGWGYGGDGELGDQASGSGVGSLTPVQISLPGGIGATAISAGDDSVLAIGSNGVIYAWGANSYGQLGDGTATGPDTCTYPEYPEPCSPTPIAVTLPGGVAATAVSAGAESYEFSLALGADGNVYAWGYNDIGQLGNGSTSESLTPTVVSLPGATMATAISAGDATGLAIVTGAPPAPVFTTTTLTTSIPEPIAGETVALTATVTAANGSQATGDVIISVNNTVIGVPTPVGADGVATLDTYFGAGNGIQLTAVFVPADSAAYSSSFGYTTVPAVITGPFDVGAVPATVSVPPTGTLTITINTGPISLTLYSNDEGAYYTTPNYPIEIDDTRNTYPGWSVLGQVSDFTGSGSAAGSSIPGNDLGWTPSGTPENDATRGPTVVAGSPGIGTTPAVLASAEPGAGFGESDFGFELNLLFPAGTEAGPYTASLTITYIAAAL